MLENFSALKDAPSFVKCGAEIKRKYKNERLILYLDKITIGKNEEKVQSILEIEACQTLDFKF
jgi:hypothetical protein